MILPSPFMGCCVKGEIKAYSPLAMAGGMGGELRQKTIPYAKLGTRIALPRFTV
jgi:hypothetical protein